MKNLISSLALLWGLTIAQLGSAYVITSTQYLGTDVGSLDTLIGTTNSLTKSSTAAETNWVNSLLNPDTNYVMKTETVNYFATDAANVFAFRVYSDPGYFIVKNAQWWALYQNNASSDWGVIDLSQLNSGFNLSGTGGMTISHVTEFGNFVSVPEPSSLALLCLGLLGLVLFRRRYKS